jgi:hypothetical protein
MVTGTLTPEVRQLGREADHSSPSSTKVRNSWSHISTPQYVFIAWLNRDTTLTCTLFYLYRPTGVNIKSTVEVRHVGQKGETYELRKRVFRRYWCKAIRTNVTKILHH